MSDTFAAGGALARALPGHERREGQRAMSDAVARAIDSDGVLVCEAGTGTGKTLAYLIPAVASGRRVVIATATKALQEQILEKDLPIAARVVGRDPQAALVKGLGNYLCKRRFDELRKSSRPLADPTLLRSLPLVEAWARETESGDVAELSALPEGDPLWREIASSSETRIGQGCVHHEDCFVTKMKRRMQDARILVVNHHLLFADLAIRASAGEGAPIRASALPPYDAVILDEAHRIEDIATEFFGTRVSTAKVSGMLRDAERAFVAAGLSDRLLAKGEGGALVEVVRGAFDELFAVAARRVPPGGEGRVLLRDDAFAEAELGDAWRRCDSALEALEGWSETHAVAETVDQVRRRAASLREDLARVAEPGTARVGWLEVRARSTAMGASPVGVGRLLRERLWDRVGGAVLTSATLASVTTPPRPQPKRPHGDEDEDAPPPSSDPRSSASPFAFLRARLGLDANLKVPVEELLLPTPFDVARRAILYVPRDLPEAADAAFASAAAERISALVAITGGGAFVLCTSVRGQRAIARELAHRLPRRPLVQGDAPRGALLARFRAGGDEVLVGTASFWEGVDVRGDALRLVVVEKLPFAVPTDPVFAARCAAIEARGGRPFDEYAVPEATLHLKQGFGRLLRSKTDRGIVAILDRRVVTRGYGARILAALPPAPRTASLDDVKAFWERVVEEDSAAGTIPTATPAGSIRDAADD
jgi:ATP-dependent DNA helicase DinG